MTKIKNTRRALLSSALVILMCVAMLIGTTFAWFTDTASTGVNRIQAGKLDVDIVNAAGTDSITGSSLSFKSADNTTVGENIKWEPNCTYRTEGFQIKNAETLALKYKVTVTGTQGNIELLDVIKFSLVKDNGEGGYTVVTDDLANYVGHLTAGTLSGVLYIQGHMDQNAGNTYMEKTLSNVSITVTAAQDAVEQDSNGSTYDANAAYTNN